MHIIIWNFQYHMTLKVKKKRKLKTSWYSFTNYCSFILFQTKLYFYLNSLFVGKILFKSYKHETRQLKWKMLSKSHSNLVSKYRHKCVFFLILQSHFLSSWAYLSDFGALMDLPVWFRRVDTSGPWLDTVEIPLGNLCTAATCRRVPNSRNLCTQHPQQTPHCNHKDDTNVKSRRHK